MKSSFLLVMILSFAVNSAWGQTVKKTETAKETSAFDKFYDRLKISYFGAYQGSSIGQWTYGALDEKGKVDKTYPHNLFNQVSFNYNFGARLNFVLNPRFTINTGSTIHAPSIANGVFVLEDMLTGFQGVLLSSANKKFNWWTRIGARLPTSRTSRVNNVTMQPEWMSIFSYDFNPTWQLGSYLQLRNWAYDDKFTAYRYRVYAAPYIMRTINDTTKLQIFYEAYLENRGNLHSQNKKSPNFQNYWRTLMVAVSKDVTPKLNFMPFLVQHLNSTTPIDKYPLDTMGVGFWLSYQIK